MPPSGFSRPVVAGALQFVEGCYRDLLEEVRSGKHKTYEDAITFEINQINRVLTRLHIDAEGNLIEK
jgi:hypothetical protein